MIKSFILRSGQFIQIPGCRSRILDQTVVAPCGLDQFSRRNASLRIVFQSLLFLDLQRKTRAKNTSGQGEERHPNNKETRCK